ncbi:MAG: hypothetical protein ABEJ31_11350 [Haloarculaceae archaeon]
MTRPRPDDIVPMVPELPTATVRADGGVPVSRTADAADEPEADAPLVPDLS